MNDMVSVADRLSFTIQTASLLAGIPEKTIREAIRSGDLHSFTTNRYQSGSMTVRIRRRELEDWLNTL